jgi:hypothetical protein
MAQRRLSTAGSEDRDGINLAVSHPPHLVVRSLFRTTGYLFGAARLRGAVTAGSARDLGHRSCSRNIDWSAASSRFVLKNLWVSGPARYFVTVILSSAPSLDKQRHRAFVAHLICIPIGLVYMLWGSRRLRFFGDEWAIILNRREMWAQHRWADFLFLPHNEHWSTLPILAYSTTLKIFGLSSYVPYMCVLLGVHAVGVVLFRVLTVRAGFSPWSATLASGVFLVLGSGAEDLAWGFQIGFVGSVTLGLLLLILADSALGPPWLGCIVAIAGLMTSGVSLVMVLISCVVLALRCQWRRLLFFGGIPAIVFVGWYVTWGRSTTVPPVHPVPSLTPAYVWRGTTNALDGVTQLRGGGPIMVLALLVLLSLLRNDTRKNALLIAGLVAPFLIYLVNSIGRASFGIEQSLASRYVYVCAPFILLSLLACFGYLREGNSRNVFVWLLLGWAIVGNSAEFLRFTKDRGEVTARAWHQIVGAAAVPGLYAEQSSITVEPIYSPDVGIDGLSDLVSLGLPVNEAVPQDLANAMGRFGLRTPTNEPDFPASVELVANDKSTTVTPVGESCWSMASPSGPSKFRLRVLKTGRIVITPSGDVDAVVHARSDGGLDSPETKLQFRGPTAYVAVAIPGDLVLDSSNPVTICIGS